MVETGCRPSNQSSSGIIVTPSESDIYRAVGDWLKATLPSGFSVLQGQANRTPSPTGPYAAMVIVTKRRLATNAWSYGAGTRSVIEPTHIAVQVNLFGAGAGDAVQQIQLLWRDFYTTDFMRALGNVVSPLDTSDPRQSPFINAEANYEDEWSIDLRCQANVTTTIPQDFALSASPNAMAADTLTIVE